MISPVDPQLLVREFAGRFGSAPELTSVPGRVNLIGEHTDYNQGLVMPTPVALHTWIAAAPRRDRHLHVYSTTFGESVRLDLDARAAGAAESWSVYVSAVAQALEEAGHRLCGADLLIEGELPIGAGLSSSASLEVATARALLRLSGLELDDVSLAKLCHRAEAELVGVRCGIMDQYAVACSRMGEAMLLDCRTLETRTYCLPRDAALIVVDSGIRRRLADGEYNRRRRECEAAVAAIAERHPTVRSLRDVSPALLEASSASLEPRLHRRARHVVTENRRVEAASEALRAADLPRLGRLLGQSHESLRGDFEVSLPALDRLVTIATACDGVFGARMTGGGFGGCVLALAEASRAEAVSETLRRAAAPVVGSEPWMHVAGPVRSTGDGCA